MSIQANMKPYQLSIYTETEDALGTIIKGYVGIEVVNVSVNFTQMSSVENGIAYRINKPLGITDYKEFAIYDMNDYTVAELGEVGEETLYVNALGNPQFRLVGNGHTFDIESINQEGRYTQLVLKEVFINGK